MPGQLHDYPWMSEQLHAHTMTGCPDTMLPDPPCHKPSVPYAKLTSDLVCIMHYVRAVVYIVWPHPDCM